MPDDENLDCEEARKKRLAHGPAAHPSCLFLGKARKPVRDTEWQTKSAHETVLTVRSADLSAIAHALHLQFARLSCRPWFEWVPSEANPADIPSRQGWHHPLYDEMHARS